jgi:hypothetical protein
MAVLTAAVRNKLKTAVFGLPKQRKYPMPDFDHAVDAKARARQELNDGKLSRGDYEQIVTMANHMMAKYRSNG